MLPLRPMIFFVEELSSQLRPALCYQFYLYRFLAEKNQQKLRTPNSGSRREA